MAESLFTLYCTVLPVRLTHRCTAFRSDVSSAAHLDAYEKTGYLHHDLSPGNLLAHEDDSGRTTGLLTDWELSRPKDDAELGSRRIVSRRSLFHFSNSAHRHARELGRSCQ